jgi:hypothetical protein
VKKQTA